MNNFLISAIFILIILFSSYLSINKKDVNKDDLVEGLNTFVGRMAVDDQYFYDKTFDDVFYYPNEPEGVTGWDRCNSECPGRCVENGIYGSSWCFAY